MYDSEDNDPAVEHKCSREDTGPPIQARAPESPAGRNFDLKTVRPDGNVCITSGKRFAYLIPIII